MQIVRIDVDLRRDLGHNYDTLTAASSEGFSKRLLCLVCTGRDNQEKMSNVSTTCSLARTAIKVVCATCPNSHHPPVAVMRKHT